MYTLFFSLLLLRFGGLMTAVFLFLFVWWWIDVLINITIPVVNSHKKRRCHTIPSRFTHTHTAYSIQMHIKVWHNKTANTKFAEMTNNQTALEYELSQLNGITRFFSVRSHFCMTIAYILMEEWVFDWHALRFFPKNHSNKRKNIVVIHIWQTTRTNHTHIFHIFSQPSEGILAQIGK